MPAVITLTAVPGHIERHAGYSAKTIEIWGRELDRTTKPVATVRDVRATVQAFGKALRERQPGSSFAILVSVRRGDRKPSGFDAAHRGNGFGQDDFLHVRDQHPERAEVPEAGVPTPASVPPTAA